MVNCIIELVIIVAPVRERGLKYQLTLAVINTIKVAPVRERGLKSDIRRKPTKAQNSRSREGAWIEINFVSYRDLSGKVAPVRERGLKYHIQVLKVRRRKKSLP